MLFHLRTAINCCLFIALLLLPLPGAAQGVATVLGTITDQSGAVVPGCKVVLENLETGVSAATQTDGNGTYRFVEMRIGRYRVVTEAPGFKSATTDAFILTVDARQRADVTLQVGATTQTVEVTGAAAALETDSSNRGQLVLHDAVVDLPLNGRSYADLSLLSPGVRPSVLSNMAKREAA